MYLWITAMRASVVTRNTRNMMNAINNIVNWNGMKTMEAVLFEYLEFQYTSQHQIITITEKVPSNTNML